MTADTPSRKPAAAADPEAREFLRDADPVLAQLIDARPDFRPRAWMDELPPLDAFATLIFQVVGQQLSVAATRTIVSRIEERFGGRRQNCSQPIRRCFAPPDSRRARARRCGHSRSDSSTDA
jgi:3-methyladenine DNA glycosylase/8-oxoguanine DNA glycosylase